MNSHDPPAAVATPPGDRTSTSAPRLHTPPRIVTAVRRFVEARNHLRKGICLLNAGKFAEATRELSAAADTNPDCQSLASALAASMNRTGRHAEAAEHLGHAAAGCASDTSTRIREGLSWWKAGAAGKAVATLRLAVAEYSDSAEAHFQLATVLAALDERDEAERILTRAVVLDPNHADALVSLALCEAARRDPRAALRHLARAQRLRPHDARINLLLSLAARASADEGTPQPVRAEMPSPGPEHEQAIDELSRIIEREPDFVDAFLSLPPSDIDAEMFELLAITLRRALRRQPEHADLYYHCGRILERLGRSSEAIEAAEHAIRTDPRLVKGLILLARLYARTDRPDDARARLEQSLALGAEYADTYLLLGNLYRTMGQSDRARWAYGKALDVNPQYAAAHEALATLPAEESVCAE